jgi:hypothetical protein
MNYGKGCFAHDRQRDQYLRLNFDLGQRRIGRYGL